MADERVLKALLDLRLALGELQASLIEVDRAVRELMAVELDIKKGGPGSTDDPGVA